MGQVIQLIILSHMMDSRVSNHPNYLFKFNVRYNFEEKNRGFKHQSSSSLLHEQGRWVRTTNS